MKNESTKETTSPGFNKTYFKHRLENNKLAPKVTEEKINKTKKMRKKREKNLYKGTVRNKELETLMPKNSTPNNTGTSSSSSSNQQASINSENTKNNTPLNIYHQPQNFTINTNVSNINRRTFFQPCPIETQKQQFKQNTNSLQQKPPAKDGNLADFLGPNNKAAILTESKDPYATAPADVITDNLFLKSFLAQKLPPLGSIIEPRTFTKQDMNTMWEESLKLLKTIDGTPTNTSKNDMSQK